MGSFRLYSSLPGGDTIPNTRALIDRAAIASNYIKLLSAVRRSNAETEGIAVVKADAYAHSNEICAPAIAAAGCRNFAVSSIAEAEALRNILDAAGYAGVRITVLGYTPPAYSELLIKYNITQCVYSLEYARSLSEAIKSPLEVDVKLDTGMNRLGVSAKSLDGVNAAADEIMQIASLKNLSIHGMFSHFPVADCVSAEADAFTLRQYEIFMSVDAELRRRGLNIAFRHICNSAAALRFPEFALEGVRLGIFMYGCGDASLHGLELTPVMRFETVISHVHEVKAGESIGYGAAYTAERDMRIATMPVGYADGFLRAYEGAEIIVLTGSGEEKLRLVGRICMDQCMADATGKDVCIGDRVILFGKDSLMLKELAVRAETIEYESLCLVSARVPRIALN